MLTDSSVDHKPFLCQVLRSMVPDPCRGTSDEDGSSLFGRGEGGAEGEEDELIGKKEEGDREAEA